MRLTKASLLAALCCGSIATAWNPANLQGQDIYSNMPPQPVYSQDGYASGATCDCGETDCGCEMQAATCGCEDTCDGGCESYGDCGGGGIFEGGCLGGSCGLGDPYSILGECCGYKMGGWAQLGYHNKNNVLFNNRKHDFQLHQAWVYLEKELDTSNGFATGGRIDYIYGTDGPNTQSFGIDNNHWDNQWDNGGDYGHAIPQVYAEAGYGKWSAKAGHFYTIIGYEVVAAPENFFYSHAYTMNYSEPFTHTGAMLTYDMTEDVELFGGYVLGWDSGFDDNGDAVIGGGSFGLTDDINVTSTFVAGRFADNLDANERGVMSSTVATLTLSERLDYIFQADVLDTEDVNGATVRKTFGINQYLIREVSDRVSIGSRFEWWNVEADSQGFYGPGAPAGLGAVATGDYDIFALTLGTNIRPHANVLIRPEVRWDWVDGDRGNLQTADLVILEDNDKRQTTFGIDTIFMY